MIKEIAELFELHKEDVLVFASNRVRHRIENETCLVNIDFSKYSEC